MVAPTIWTRRSRRRNRDRRSGGRNGRGLCRRRLGPRRRDSRGRQRIPNPICVAPRARKRWRRRDLYVTEELGRHQLHDVGGGRGAQHTDRNGGSVTGAVGGHRVARIEQMTRRQLLGRRTALPPRPSHRRDRQGRRPRHGRERRGRDRRSGNRRRRRKIGRILEVALTRTRRALDRARRGRPAIRRRPTYDRRGHRRRTRSNAFGDPVVLKRELEWGRWPYGRRAMRRRIRPRRSGSLKNFGLDRVAAREHERPPCARQRRSRAQLRRLGRPPLGRVRAGADCCVGLAVRSALSHVTSRPCRS